MLRSYSTLSDLHHLDEILSNASQFNLAIIGRNHVIQGDFEVSDNDNDSSDTISVVSAGSQASIYKPNINRIKYCALNTNDTVELSCVESYQKMFVRPVKFDAQCEDLMKNINCRQHRELSPTIRLEADDVVLAIYADDFCRGVVLDPIDDGEKKHIELLDFGKTIISNLDDIRYISRDSAGTDRLAVPVVLNVPKFLSEKEKTAVYLRLKKYEHNRFRISSCAATSSIEPNDVVDLHFLLDEESILKKCTDDYNMKKTIEDIRQKNYDGKKTELLVIENELISCGLITCVLKGDIQIFVQQFADVTEYGRSISRNPPYLPAHKELCLVLYADSNGEEHWYRSQFHQKLANNRAQVGLIDFGITIKVQECNIRAFPPHFDFDCLSMLCKMRARVDLELLDDVHFANYSIIEVEEMKPMGKFHDIVIPDRFFMVEEDYS